MEPDGLAVHSTALHGEKVGVGTVLASAEYHRLAEMEDISGAALPYQPINQERLRAFFGEKLYPVAKRENEKECLAAVTVDTLVRTWPEIRQIISEIPMPEAVDGLLKQIGAKHCLPDIGVAEEKRGELLDWSPLIRNRLTLMRIRRMIRH